MRTYACAAVRLQCTYNKRPGKVTTKPPRGSTTKHYKPIILYYHAFVCDTSGLFNFLLPIFVICFTNLQHIPMSLRSMVLLSLYSGAHLAPLAES